MNQKLLVTLFFFLFVIGQIFTQNARLSDSNNNLTIWAYFDTYIYENYSLKYYPKKEFPQDAMPLIVKYCKYFKAIGWDGICTIQGNWFYEDYQTTKEIWRNALSSLKNHSFTNNYIKFALNYENRTGNAKYNYFIPLWNDSYRWQSIYDNCEQINVFANEINASGILIDNETYDNVLVWSYLIHEFQPSSVTKANYDMVIYMNNYDINSLAGSICRVVWCNSGFLQSPDAFKHQWLAQVNADGSLVLNDRNYIYRRNAPSDTNPLKYILPPPIGQFKIFTEPPVAITSTDHGSSPNGNYFVRFSNGLGFNEDCHVIYHNPLNNRHYEWFGKTNQSGWGEFVLNEAKEKLKFETYSPARSDIGRIFIYNVDGLPQGRLCTVIYIDGATQYKWITRIPKLTSEYFTLKTMVIEENNEVGSVHPSTAFYQNKHLPQENFIIKSIDGGVIFSSSSPGNINDDKYWITGIPIGDPDIFNGRNCKVIYYTLKDTSGYYFDKIYCWNSNIIFSDDDEYAELMICPDSLDSDLSKGSPNITFYQTQQADACFQICIDFDYNVNHADSLFKLFNRQYVKDLVYSRGYELAENLANNKPVFVLRAETYEHDLSDDFIKGVKDAISNTIIGNEESYFDINFPFSDAQETLQARFETDNVIFGISPIENAVPFLSKNQLLSHFQNILAFNTGTGLNFMYTTGSGNDWYFKSLQTDVLRKLNGNPETFIISDVSVGSPGDFVYWLHDMGVGSNGDFLDVGDKVRVEFKSNDSFFVWDCVVRPFNSTDRREIRLADFNAVLGLNPNSAFYEDITHIKDSFYVYEMDFFRSSDVRNANSIIPRKFLHWIPEDKFNIGNEYRIVYYDGSVIDTNTGYPCYYEWKCIPQTGNDSFRELFIDTDNAIIGENNLQIEAPNDFYSDDVITLDTANYKIYKYFDNEDFISIMNGTYSPEINKSSNDLNIPTLSEIQSCKVFFSNTLFQDHSTIRFILPKQSHVKIMVYNILGQRVRTLADDERQPGAYEIIWDGRDNHGTQVSSGSYFLRFEAGEFKTTKSLTVIR
ncbi:MAG: hypothetical protein JXB49_27960 [Bacteroidales bacterium]|nr:hypothetical protein [Bacteroidales bacterium]